MPLSRVISLRLKDDDLKRLDRVARKHAHSAGAAAALLLHEKLREEDFPFVEFRDSAVGRQAYVKGHRLTVWEVVYFTRQWGLDAKQYAEYLQWPEYLVEVALDYARSFPDEIEPLVAEIKAESLTFDDIKRIVPWIQEVKVNV
jgi:hypothetical protein